MENNNHEEYGNPRNTGDEDYKSKPKQNHSYGHTPQIQKGAKTSNSGVKRIPFVTVRRMPICFGTGLHISAISIVCDTNMLVFSAV